MQEQEKSVKTAIEIAIKLGTLGIILVVSFLILKPFLGLVAWSVIIAVALFPFVQKTSKRLNTSIKKVAISLAVVVNLALIVPTYFLSTQAIDSISALTEIAKDGEFKIPPPPQKLQEFPLVGKKAYGAWDGASKNLEGTIETFAPQIKEGASKIAGAIGGTLSMILLSMVSIIIAVFLMLGAEKYTLFYKKISTRLIGKRGDEWATLTALTIRSVANGVIGVAVIQAVLSLLGLVLMNVPFSIVIALAVMFLTIIQLPAIIIIGPVIALVLSQDTSVGAIVFSVYMLIVGASDGVLKPMLMGRGVDIPMLVVLIGAIGGMMLMGMIGLFVGAVIFSLAYKLFVLWLDDTAIKA